MRGEPGPLLPRTSATAKICEVEGELAVEVSPEGRATVEFVSDTPVVGGQGAADAFGTRDVDAILSDGRRTTLHECVLQHAGASFTRGAGWTFRLRLFPRGITIVCSDDAPSRAEFALVNQWIVLREGLLFDGVDLEIRPADPDAGGHAVLQKGKPAWITHWVTAPAADPLAEQSTCEIIECLAYTLSLLTMEHVVVPLRHVLNAQGEIVRWEFQSTFWPLHRGLNTVYVNEIAVPLRVVGTHQVSRKFAELGLKRYIDYLLESQRLDMYAEVCLACVLFALESLGARWFLAEGCPPEELIRKSIITKLDHINSSLRLIRKRYKSDWLYHGLRNPLMHTGAVPLMDLAEIHRAKEQLLVLAADIFFGIFGFRRSVTKSGPRPD